MSRVIFSPSVTPRSFLEDVRDLVKRTIEDGAPGGGFTLKTTGGAVGCGKTKEQCIKEIDCNLSSY